MDKSFYKKVLVIAIPIIIQQLVLSSFQIIDSMMLSNFDFAIGGVGLATQISNFVITIIFGFNVGIGIYISQYLGKKDANNIKKTFALMAICCFIISLLATIICYFFAENLILMFKPTSDEALNIGIRYLKIASFSFIPNFLTYSFSIGYRNIQKTHTPLIVSVISLLLNCFLNYCLIFGNFGFPRLEIEGAAYATLISTSCGLLLSILLASIKKEIFLPSFRHFKNAIKKPFCAPILKRCISFVGNESLFGIGMLLIVMFYNKFGSEEYESVKIAENFYQLFIVAATGIGTATSSMIGEKLGQDDFASAKTYAIRFIKIGLIVSSILGVICLFGSKFLVSMYTINNETIKKTAQMLLIVYSFKIVLRTFVVILFSIFRASGKSKLILFLDAGILYFVAIPICLLSVFVFNMNNIIVFASVLLIELIVRISIGMYFFLKTDFQENLTF